MNRDKGGLRGIAVVRSPGLVFLKRGQRLSDLDQQYGARSIFLLLSGRTVRRSVSALYCFLAWRQAAF